MRQQIWTENYKIASYLVNLRGRAGLYAILNFIQDVGWLHALHLEVKLQKNRGWVFTRQKLRMTSWPTWNETITVQTWLRSPQEAFLYRDYELFVGGEKVGECTSTFTVMDMETRRVAIQDWSELKGVWREEGLLSGMPEKIVYSDDVENLAPFEVRNSDIDLNHHVNNTRYAQWILDALPIDHLRKGANLIGYDVNFLAESKIGDVVTIQKVREEKKEGPISVLQFQGLRSSDGKPVFTALLHTVDAK